MPPCALEASFWNVSAKHALRNYLVKKGKSLPSRIMHKASTRRRKKVFLKQGFLLNTLRSFCLDGKPVVPCFGAIGWISTLQSSPLFFVWQHWISSFPAWSLYLAVSFSLFYPFLDYLSCKILQQSYFKTWQLHIIYANTHISSIPQALFVFNPISSRHFQALLT